MAKPKGKSIHLTWDQMNALYHAMGLMLDDLWEDVEDPEGFNYESSRKRLSNFNAINKKMCKAFNIMDQYEDWEDRSGLDC